MENYAVYYLLFTMMIFTLVCSNKDDVDANTSASSNGGDPEDLDPNGLPIHTFDVQLPVLSGSAESIIAIDQ